MTPSNVKWVDGYYDHKDDVPLEKIGDGKDLEFVPLAVVLLADLADVVEGLRTIAYADWSPSINEEIASAMERGEMKHITAVEWLAQRLLAKLEGKG